MPKKPRNPARSLRYGQGWVEITGETKAQARWKEGSRYRAKTFHGETLQEAIDKAEEHIRIESRYTIDPDTHDATVTDITEAWLRHGKLKWTANTYSQYQMHFNTHIKPVLGHLRARDVTTARIQQLVDKLVDKGLAPGSVRLIYVVVKGPFSEATRQSTIRTNPAQGIELPKIRKKRKVTWSIEHIQRVLEYLEEDPFWSALYRFALTTGVRPGELIALRWEDVDFDEGRATVWRTLTRNEKRQYVIGDDTKTHEPRTINVSPDTLVALYRWRVAQNEFRKAAPHWLDTDLIFTATYGYHLQPKTWRAFHKALCQKLGVPPMTPHGTRHTLATSLMSANEHPVIVKDILGHRNIKTTLDQYSHPSIDLQSRAMLALEARIAGPKPTEKG